MLEALSAMNDLTLPVITGLQIPLNPLTRGTYVRWYRFHSVSVELKTAIEYRQFAEERRLEAEKAGRKTRRTLIDIALQYDHLADMLEADDAAMAALGNHPPPERPSGN